MPSAFRRFLAARLDRESDLGLRLSVSVALFGAAVWGFSGLLEEVLDNDALVRWDHAVESWFHAHATPAGLRALDVVTQLGSPGVWVVALVVTIWLWRRQERFLAWAWLASNASGKLIQLVLKDTVHRRRPQYAAAFLHGHSYSFPSGHAMGSMICYGLLVYVLSRVYRWDRARTAVASAMAAALVLLICFSRLYLGVHYPSDVTGGVLAGAAWLVVCLSVIHLVQHRQETPRSSANAQPPNP